VWSLGWPVISSLERAPGIEHVASGVKCEPVSARRVLPFALPEVASESTVAGASQRGAAGGERRCMARDLPPAARACLLPGPQVNVGPPDYPGWLCPLG
jgi:hypothetical protein